MNIIKGGKGFVVSLIGLLITISLLVFMTSLIHTPQPKIAQPLEVTPTDDSVEPTQKPEKVTNSLKPAALVIEPAIEGLGVPVTESYQMSNLNSVPVDLTNGDEFMSLAPLTFQQAAHSVDSGLVAIFQAQPQYPVDALSKGLEGWVKLAYDVDKTGRAVNIKVIAAKPRKVFDLAAKKSTKTVEV
ncbi:TonB family protein [Kangiella sp. TOML190]|uniref:TonB family protein n=1 Tax=Kangiella sp. TOML190 TaxID=2931351 RepID=UPI00203DCFC1|nr:TonB family protein [Kangiella sp. TOML190]